MESDCSLCPYISVAEAKLDGCQLKQLSENHIVVGFKKGDSIIKQGTYSTNIIFLRKGLVKIHITGPYSEQIVKLAKPPTYLGLPTTFGAKVNQYSITALEDCEVCFIDITVFRNLLKESEHFSFEIIQALCRYEIESFRRCANRTQKLTRGNLADVLLDFANNIFQSDVFTVPISQTEIGNLIDTSRESVSRMLSEFEKDGIIRTTGKQMEIVNKKSLELISQNG
ncbi:MAG: Crp/Fnr family transcriptional regulator [Paludibacter sp.]|jgi:CRP/FNR family transcriptional regulator|nr:Crp/Fnr family transcriptional regulator [Paludibacter sp.]